EQLGDGVGGQPWREAILPASGVGGGPERIQHSLLRRIDGCLEERVERAVGNGLDGRPRPALLAGAAAGGCERDEDLAAAVMGGRAGASEAEAGAARDALELEGAERGVGRDDGYAAPRGVGPR